MFLMPRTLIASTASTVSTTPRCTRWQAAGRRAAHLAALAALAALFSLRSPSAQAQTPPTDPNAGKPDGYYLQSYTGGTYTKSIAEPNADYVLSSDGETYGCYGATNISQHETAVASGTITGTFVWHSDAGNPPPPQVIEEAYCSVAITSSYTYLEPDVICDNGFSDDNNCYSIPYGPEDTPYAWLTYAESTGTHYRVRSTAGASTGTASSDESFTSQTAATATSASSSRTPSNR